jgi:hypothetical protein
VRATLNCFAAAVTTNPLQPASTVKTRFGMDTGGYLPAFLLLSI